MEESSAERSAFLPTATSARFYVMDLQIAALRDDLGLRAFVPFVSFCSLPASRRLGTGTEQKETKETKRKPGAAALMGSVPVRIWIPGHSL
jgi:hypothetical protein